LPYDFNGRTDQGFRELHLIAERAAGNPMGRTKYYIGLPAGICLISRDAKLPEA
jgi:hypothetical protein